MRGIPTNFTTVYNMVTKNNQCKKCYKPNNRIRLSINDIKSIPGIDIDERIREMFEKAQVIYNELAALKRFYNSNDKNNCDMYLLRKNLILSNADKTTDE